MNWPKMSSLSGLSFRDWNEEHKNGISYTKMGRDITTYALKHKMENVCPKVKKVNGKSIRIWVGIRTNEGDLGI